MHDTDPLIGLDLGGYVVSRLMASGGMGLVYEAQHPAIGRRAAVKVLKPELANDTQWSRRFLTEARAIAALNHRNIVEILNFGQTPDGRQFMMMAFLEGESLEAYVAKEAPLAPAVALNLADQVLNGLAEAHKKGVVHRDLKPSNVWLVREHSGELLVKLLDFGLARQDPVAPAEAALSTRTQAGASILAGTPEYIAPEQALGEVVSASADLYALGVVLFEMLAGRLPFQSTSVGELLNLHVNEAPPSLDDLVPDLPDGVSALVDSLLRKEPAQRPSSADVARQQIQRLLKRLARDATTARASAPRHTAPEGDLAGGQTIKLQRPEEVVRSTDRVARQARPTTAQALDAAFPGRAGPGRATLAGLALGGLALLGSGAWWGLRAPPSPTAPTPSPAPRATAPVPAPPSTPPIDASAPAPPVVEAPPPPSRLPAVPPPPATPPPAPAAHAPVARPTPPPPSPGPAPAPAPPTPARAEAVPSCEPDARWRSNLKQDLADLAELAARDPALFAAFHGRSEELARAIQSATTPQQCAATEAAVETLRKKVTNSR